MDPAADKVPSEEEDSLQIDGISSHDEKCRIDYEKQMIQSNDKSYSELAFKQMNQCGHEDDDSSAHELSYEDMLIKQIKKAKEARGNHNRSSSHTLFSESNPGSFTSNFDKDDQLI